METTRFTVVQIDGAAAVDAQVNEAAGTVRLSASAVWQSLGWQRKPEGLCREDVCIPSRQLAGVEDADGTFDLGALCAILNRPLAMDIAGRGAFVGVSAPDRAATLSSFVAPDFTLPDLDGRRHSLSDHRGKKVFLATWASW